MTASKVVAKPIRQCPLCNSVDSKVLIEEEHEFPGEWSYLNEEPVRILRCQKCGFGFTGALPPQAFFDEVLYGSIFGNGEIPGPNMPAGKEKIFRHILQLLARHQAHGRLVDLGTSTGRFLWHARNQFNEVLGVENDARNAVAAKEHGIEIIAGSILEVLPKLPFSPDVITLIDVLEHLPNPMAHLLAIRDALESDGLLYIKVPHQWGQLYKERIIAMLRLRSTQMATQFVHVNHFSEASLVRALRSIGFKIEYAHVAPPEIYQWRLRPRELLSNTLRCGQYRLARAIRSICGLNFGLNLEVLARKIC